ncbi:hypothetical protein, partial [Leclercia sp.]|uniref:hypothetical protein n=1 Tax=Leclercia sp. TaxID=1898428 RepID=UPI0028A162FE
RAVQRGFRSPLRGGVYYAFLFQSQAIISRFSLLTRRLVCRCSVSVEAHYRQFFWGGKYKVKIIY